MNRIASVGGQIPLALSIKEKPGFDLFVVGDNSETCHSIKSIAKGIKQSSCYLWGQSGCGVSHLLQAACMLADDHKRKVSYIPLKDHAALDPEVLENLDSMDVVCIDDIDSIAGELDWEQPLLHLYNRLREKGCVMLIGAHTGPKALGFQLQDLKSRMVWDLVYHLKLLDDYSKIDVLRLRANARAFELPREVAEYLVKRVRRDLPGLIKLLDQFEEATLIEKRKLTVPFVKELLSE